jgi:hypothetical protein
MAGEVHYLEVLSVVPPKAGLVDRNEPRKPLLFIASIVV